MRLESRFRLALYAAFAVLFLTGVIWLFADAWKDGADGETWQAVAANLLMVHGGVAMATLLLLGALFPLHMQRGWRARRNRPLGVAMVSLNGALVVTAFGLYYLGSDVLRAWTSDVHIGAGLLLPVLLGVHVVFGRRAS